MVITFDELITLLNIDTLTLIVSGVLVFLAIVTPLLSPFFKAVKPSENLEDEDQSEVSEIENQNGEPEETSSQSVDPLSGTDFPSVSLVLTPHDNAEELARNLETYLEQDYAGEYEVIVVTWKGDHETDDILKQYGNNKRLYTTYIPESSRYMSREKLAVTIGVKAAKHEWVVLSDIACRPDSNEWLQALAAGMTDDHNLVLTHTRYEEKTAAFRRFVRIYKELYLMREIFSGTAYRSTGSCLAFRRSEFMKGEGYRGNLKYLRGEYDFLVNKYARESSTVLALDRRAWLMEQEPTDKHWLGNQLFYLENRCHFERSVQHRRMYNLHQWGLHLNVLMQLVAIVFGCMSMHWLMVGVAAILFVVSYCVHNAMGAKVMRAWSEPISTPTIYFKELSMVWLALSLCRRYALSNKNDFISHKI